MTARLLGAVAPAVLLLPLAAHAETVVVDDAAGDVVTALTDPLLLSGGNEEPVPAPDSTSPDITSTTIDHRDHRLDVTMSFRDLRASFSDTVVMRIRTPRARFAVYAERRGNQTMTASLIRRTDRVCRGLTTTVEPGADRIAVSVPTDCLNDPRWVQVGVVVLSTDVLHDPDVGDQILASIDDPFAVGFDQRGPRFGPRVPRG